MMMKYKVSEVAKDLNVSNKEVLDILKDYGEPKKSVTALVEDELDIVFETFTQKRNMENLDAYFASADQPVVAEQPAEAPKAEEDEKV